MRYLLLCLPLFILSACSGARAPSIDIQNAHIVDPIGAQTVTLGGLEITALGETIRLVEASTPAAERIEIHTTTQDDAGRMQMRRLEDVTIAKDTTAKLGSGKTHLMVFGLDERLNAGDTVDLMLTYQQGDAAQSTITVTATITAIGQDHTQHGS